MRLVGGQLKSTESKKISVDLVALRSTRESKALALLKITRGSASRDDNIMISSLKGFYLVVFELETTAGFYF